ncbi:MAG: tetratricopeptide repeat protein, partial [Planctomycetota bacterium]
RPRDAEAVARAVHEYLSSVEERAHKAEVAATAARIKTQEQRRRLRLTIALAGSVFATMLLGGGGWWWIQQERAGRTAKVRDAVEAAFAESIQLGQAGRPADALEAARRGLALTTANDVDAVLRERASTFVQQAETAVAAADRERALLAQDETLRQRLIDLRLQQIETIGDRDKEQALHAQFVAAFRDYGVDLDGAEITPVLERMRERRIAEEIALALDDLGRIRRNLFGQHAEEFQRVAALAMDLDPDADRLRLRLAIRDDDLPTLLAFASPDRLGNLPAGSLWVLSATLWDRHAEHRPDVYRLYDQALFLYPNDYVLQAIGANIYRLAGRHDAALACRRAAFALQPDNVQARYDLGEGLFFAGRMVDALGVYRACVAKAPDHAPSHFGLGWAHVQLGDFDAARACFQRAVELDPQEQFRGDLLTVRYLSRQATKEELLRMLRGTSVIGVAMGVALALADHPDVALRDLGTAIEVARDPAFGPDYARAGALIECIAHVHLGEWSAAQQALDRFDPRTEYLLLTPACLPFVRAVIHAGAGRREAARESLLRGLEGFRDLVGTDEQTWARSDLVRWRAAAERALPQ